VPPRLLQGTEEQLEVLQVVVPQVLQQRYHGGVAGAWVLAKGKAAAAADVGFEALQHKEVRLVSR